MAKKHWIQSAIKHPGAFTKKAKSAGESVSEYASDVVKKKHEGKNVGSTTLKQALLAKTLAKMRRKKGKK